MSQELAKPHPVTMATDTFTEEQLNLIKGTVAKNATNAELQLFLYRCKNMALDPLKPNQVHFIKYGNNPGTMVVGLDGFRTRASKTGLHVGTKRGIVRDENGKLVGAWAEVYRKDWDAPAREEVSFAEYTTGKSSWLDKPETMIKKVAEVAALRMAFPDELGGLYAAEEMERVGNQGLQGNEKAKEVQALLDNKRLEVETIPSAPNIVVPHFEDDDDPGLRTIKIGKQFVGMKFQDVDLNQLQKFVDWARAQTNPSHSLKEFLSDAMAYLETL